MGTIHGNLLERCKELLTKSLAAQGRELRAQPMGRALTRYLEGRGSGNRQQRDRTFDSWHRRWPAQLACSVPRLSCARRRAKLIKVCGSRMFLSRIASHSITRLDELLPHNRAATKLAASA